jgi:hypothetical protein
MLELLRPHGPPKSARPLHIQSPLRRLVPNPQTSASLCICGGPRVDPSPHLFGPGGRRWDAVTPTVVRNFHLASFVCACPTSLARMLGTKTVPSTPVEFRGRLSRTSCIGSLVPRSAWDGVPGDSPLPLDLSSNSLDTVCSVYPRYKEGRRPLAFASHLVKHPLPPPPSDLRPRVLDQLVRLR